MQYKFILALCEILLLATFQVNGCTRFLYETGTQNYIVGRTMDWSEDPKTDLYAFPRGMKRNGGVGSNSIKWTSKYGSLVATFYDVLTCDGINEKGLIANILELSESDYGDPSISCKPLLSMGAWTQYILDNFSTVAEAVEELRKEPFIIIAPEFPNGDKISGHLSLSDSSGDNAIFEYINGKLVIHHNRNYPVMTNSPNFELQLINDIHWKNICGQQKMPNTHHSSDRFVRMNRILNATVKEKDPQLAIATVFSLIRAISIPLGIVNTVKPKTTKTIWRSVIDSNAKRYFFESTSTLNLFWVDLEKLKLTEGDNPSKLDLTKKPFLTGDVSDQFVPAEPFKFLGNKHEKT